MERNERSNGEDQCGYCVLARDDVPVQPEENKIKNK